MGFDEAAAEDGEPKLAPASQPHRKASLNLPELINGDAPITKQMLLWVILPICLFGFFRAFKPSEPFLFRYLRQDLGFSDDQINNEIFPIWTYSYACLLPVAFLFTEFIGFKYVMCAEVAAQLVAFVLYLQGETLQLMQLANFFAGMETATQTAYFSYGFRLVAEEYHQRMNSYASFAPLLGYFVSGIVGQVVSSGAAANITNLFYISIAATSTALVIGLVWVPSGSSIYCRGNIVLQASGALASKNTPFTRAFWRKMRSDFRTSFASWVLVCWVVWYAFACAGLNNNEGYISSLFFNLDEWQDYNGYVSAIASLVGACTTLIPNLMSSFIPNWAEWIVAVGTIACGLLTWALSRARPNGGLVPAYCYFVSYEAVIYFLTSIATARMAAHMDAEVYILVFGFTTFLSLIIQSIMQIIIGQPELGITIQTRFLIYGGFYFVLTFFSFVFAAVVQIYGRSKKTERDCEVVSQTSNDLSDESGMTLELELRQGGEFASQPDLQPPEKH